MSIKRIILVCCLWASCISFNAYAISINTWQTTNGAHVYFVSTPDIPILDIQVTFDAGSARDGENEGIANLTTNMLSEGNESLSADQLAARFDDVGAIYNQYTTRDLATVTLRTMTESLPLKQAVDTFATMLSRPSFPADSLARQKKQALNAQKSVQQSPDKASTEAFFKNAYGKHPYAHSVLGTENTVSRITRAQLQQFYQQYYVGKNAVIAMVGAINRSLAKSIAEQIAQGLAPGNSASPLMTASLNSAPILQIINFPSAQTSVKMGQVGITYNDPDFFSIFVGNHILGGDGLVSRLALALREKHGYVYNINSIFKPALAKGPFLIAFQTRNNEAGNALSMTSDVLRTFVSEGPKEQEVQEAKQYLTGSFPIQLSSNQSILGMLTLIGFYHLPVDYLDTFRDKVTSVTQQQILAAFKKHVKPDDLVTIKLGGK